MTRGDSPAHPEGYLKLDPAAYSELTTRMTDLANECCEGRLVSLFEGGYKQKPLQQCARAHVATLAGLGDFCFSAQSPARAETPNPDDKQATVRLAVGTKVMARFGGKKREFPGVIKRARDDGAYDVKYDDGDEEHGVKADHVRALTTLEAGLFDGLTMGGSL